MSILSILSAIAPAALSVGGFLAKQSAEKKASKQQSRVLQTMADLNSAADQRRIQIAQNQIQQYQPGQRLPALDRAQAELTQRLSDTVAATPQDVTGPQYTGNVSSDYTRGKSERAASDLAQAIKTAKLQAAATAPADLNMEEHFINADAGLAQQRNQYGLANDSRAQQLKLAGIAPSGGKYLAGDLAQGAGLYLGARRAQKDREAAYAQIAPIAAGRF